MTHQLTYQDHKIHVEVEGKGEVLLFLHGWPTNGRLWEAQCKLLKTNYRVIIPDWPGFGKSDKPMDYSYSLSGMTDILEFIIRELIPAQEKLTIIAHDIGGPPAIIWSSAHQARVRRLVLLNTVFYPFKTRLDKLGHLIFDTPGLSRIQLSNFGLSNLMLNLLKSREKTSRKAVREIMKRQQPWPYSIRLKTIQQSLGNEGKAVITSLAKTFCELKVDKYLVIARKDPLCFAHMQRIHEQNPQVPAHFLQNCGHFISIDQPEEFNKILKKILLIPATALQR